MHISMIAAMANNRIIGKNNQMPWHLPADFAWFKRCTVGKPVIMGRKTYDSIGKPLWGRHNIVITRNSERHLEGVTTVTSIEKAIEAAGSVDEIMIIGGGSIYQEALSIANKLYLTFIDLDVAGDTKFPDWGDGWQEIFREHYQADEKNSYNMDFVILVR